MVNSAQVDPFLESTLARVGAYILQEDLVQDRLHAIRIRVRAAVAQLQAAARGDDAVAWPIDLQSVEALIDERLHRTRDKTSLPITWVRDRFGLSANEETVLWTLIANELCPITRGLIRSISTEQTADPTTDTLRRIAYGARCDASVWQELGDNATLRRSGLIERTDHAPSTPEHRQTWKVTGRVLGLVHGVVTLDAALSDLVSMADFVPTVSGLEVSADSIARVEQAVVKESFLIVSGRVGHGRRSLLTAVAAEHGRTVLNIKGAALAKERDAARRQLRLIARECRLLALTPLFADLDSIAAIGEAPDRIDILEQEFDGLVLATAARIVPRRWRRTPSYVALDVLSGAQRAKLWSRALPMASVSDVELLSTMYPLAPALIGAAGTLAIEHSAGAEMTPEDIEAGLRAVLDDRLAGLATRISVTQTWDDLVLPDDQTTAIIELLSRIRERRMVYEDWGFAEKVGKGLGVSALFSGPPGTGKTMAAGLVARELNVELYQVDLSKIVSKWIGETEKNLAALFDAAEAGHAILLFDEADALFGKRTDVKSSNDRHANQEVNFLLQRLETYAGICILTTNHETAIDEAFRRRLSVHVRFPMPDVDERQKLWNAMIPSRAPRVGNLRLDELAAAFVMSGGYIKNAVLRAAFLAADERGAIDAARLNRAAQLEYEALGKVAPSPHRHL